MNVNKKVLLGMSGGVDSSVAAYLLKKQGYEVIGVTMKVAPDEQNCSTQFIDDAKEVAERLGVQWQVIDFRNEFKNNVIDYFIDEYMEGRTPNPCVRCNKFVKFGALLNKAFEMGADYIATGHYAKIENIDGKYIIRKAEDDRKDQTYVLYNLNQEQLSHVLMPCGDYKKSEIREIAKEIGLDVHNKKDSEEICFIPDNNHGNFIKNRFKNKIRKGNFVTKKGNVLGKHEGIINYTIGQRKGLGLALGMPVFVTDINPLTNEVIIGPEDDIFKTTLIAKDVNFVFMDELEEPIELEAKIRYSAKPSKATISPYKDGMVKVEFDEKQRAITKGQSVVFYNKDILVGGGIITEIL